MIRLVVGDKRVECDTPDEATAMLLTLGGKVGVTLPAFRKLDTSRQVIGRALGSQASVRHVLRFAKSLNKTKSVPERAMAALLLSAYPERVTNEEAAKALGISGTYISTTVFRLRKRATKAKGDKRAILSRKRGNGRDSQGRGLWSYAFMPAAVSALKQIGFTR